MKLEIYEEEEIDGNIIKAWFTPETPAETRLLDKLKARLTKFEPRMLYAIADWWEDVKDRKPRMLLKFPKCWEKN